MSAIDEARLDETFAALASGTRRALLVRLAEGDATVNELAAPFELSLPAISKHLKVLERAGLITRGRNAQFRPCRLDAEQLGRASAWVDDVRETWQTSFDRLDTYLEHLQTDPPEEAP